MPARRRRTFRIPGEIPMLMRIGEGVLGILECILALVRRRVAWATTRRQMPCGLRSPRNQRRRRPLDFPV
jgi:hypothetical protein